MCVWCISVHVRQSYKRQFALRPLVKKGYVRVGVMLGQERVRYLPVLQVIFFSCQHLLPFPLGTTSPPQCWALRLVWIRSLLVERFFVLRVLLSVRSSGTLVIPSAPLGPFAVPVHGLKLFLRSY